MKYKKLKEIIEFNPQEKINKKKKYKKIKMEDIKCFNKNISQYSIEEYNGGMKFRNGDTLLARITPCLENGKTAQVDILEENEIGYGSSEYIVMRPKDEISDKDYIYYLAISPFLRDVAIKSMVGTSGRQRVQLDVLKNLEMLIPDYEIQVKIGKILSKFDEKININNKTNDNLLELIKKLYIEKIKNNNDINFEEKNLDEFCNIFTGKKNANASEENGQYKFFTCAPEPLSINSYIYDGPAVIVAGNGAYTGRTNFYNGKFDLYQRTYGITTNNDYIYLFYAMIYTDLQNDIMGGTHGSAIPYIVMNDIAKFKVKYNKELFDELSQKIKVLLLKIKSNEAQNETLEQLRDTLLPKLMNGDIDLDKIEI